jgi:hypothetical protein
MNAGQTPVEGELMVEVSDATLAAGLDRKYGGEVLTSLAKKLEGRTPEPGFTIQECYDLVNHKPSPEFEKIYKDVKGQLTELGLSFP